MARARKAIVVGLDGIIKPWAERLMKEGRMPALARLCEQGTYAAQAYVAVPTLTPPNWTSLATGAWVGTHGVPQFRVHYAGDSLARTTNGFSSEPCQAEFMWEAAARAGKRSILVKYPGGWPPRGADIVLDGCHLHECLHVLDIARLFATDSEQSVPQVTLAQAQGWRNLPESSPAPLETQLDFDLIGHREIVEGRRLQDDVGEDHVTLYGLVTGTNGRYDRVLITDQRDAACPLATLQRGDWSEPVAVEYRQAKRRGHVRFHLLRLSEDAADFALYSTNVFPERGWAYPDDIGPELTRAVGPFLPNIGGFDTNQDWSRLGKQLGDEGKQAVLDLCGIQARWLADASAHLTSTQDWTFLWTQTHIPDCVQHMWLRTGTDPDVRREWIDRAYEIMDDFIGRMAALADDETVLVAVSDHGFLPEGEHLELVDAFAENGLLAWQEDPQDVNKATVAATPTADTHKEEKAFWAERIDWDKTLAVPYSGNEVYVNLKGREPHGVVEPGEAFEEIRDRIIELLLDCRDPKTGRRLINLALRKEECRSFGLWGDRVGDVIFTQAPETGGHGKQLPVAELGEGSIQGFLCVQGPGVRSGHVMERNAWIVDVVPTLCHLLGLPFPRDCEGAILHQLLEE